MKKFYLFAYHVTIYILSGFIIHIKLCSWNQISQFAKLFFNHQEGVNSLSYQSTNKLLRMVLFIVMEHLECWGWSWTFRRIFFFICEVSRCLSSRVRLFHTYSFSKYIEVWSTVNSTEWLNSTYIPKFWKKFSEFFIYTIQTIWNIDHI